VGESGPRGAAVVAGSAQVAVPGLAPVPAPEVGAGGLAGLLRRRWLARGAWTAAGIGLFFVYLRQASSLAMTSDSGVKALQAWDMLHGNPLLRGWTTSDVSFYTTELPQYMLIEALHGLNSTTVHIAGAMSFTLVVALAAALARGRATGGEGLVRVLVAVAVMAAPQVRLGTYLFLAGPDHLGTQVPVLLILLLLDRAPRRWWVPVAAAALLTWAQIADALVLYEVSLPLIAVCGIQVYRHRRRLAGQWYEFSLAAAAALATATASLIINAIRSAGGLHVLALNASFSGAQTVWLGMGGRLEGVLAVFGANFFTLPLGVQAAVALLHLAGLGLAAAALVRALRRYGSSGLAVQVVTAGLVVLLFAYLFSDKADLNEAVGLLPLGAVLAARMLADRIVSRGLTLALVLFLAGNCLALAANTAMPTAVSRNQVVATWLVRHDMRDGLAGYWQASSITAFSGDRSRVRPVREFKGQLTAAAAESDSSWYHPGLHHASFVIVTPAGDCANDCLSLASLTETLGRPARAYHVDSYLILTWNKNILTGVRTLNWCGAGWPWATHTTPSPRPCPVQ
jgi:hypothetical protein